MTIKCRLMRSNELVHALAYVILMTSYCECVEFAMVWELLVDIAVHEEMKYVPEVADDASILYSLKKWKWIHNHSNYCHGKCMSVCWFVDAHK